MSFDEKTLKQRKNQNAHKQASEQWKQLFEDEHRRRVKLEEEFLALKLGLNKMVELLDLGSSVLEKEVSKELKRLMNPIKTCKHGTPFDVECTRCLTESGLLL